MPRRIFIGDVHGHYEGLLRLWEQLSPAETDQVYFVGDLIDRGPRSADVVNFVMARATGCVRGNHEQLLLDAFPPGGVNMSTLQGWLYSGGQATLNSYGGSTDLLREHIMWMRTLPLYIDLGDLWLVHAGVNPHLPVAQQSSYELCWIRETFHRSQQPYFADKVIITGHTMTFTFPGVMPGQIVAGHGWYDIDTGVYHGRSGWLTALDWGAQQVYQVNVLNGQTQVGPLTQAVSDLRGSGVLECQRQTISQS